MAKKPVVKEVFPRKIYVYAPDGDAPIYPFLQTLEEIQRDKLLIKIGCLKYLNLTSLRKPYFRNFPSKRFQELYELPHRDDPAIRIVIALEDEAFLLLFPYVKQHPSDTRRALERSLSILKEIRADPNGIEEISTEKIIAIRKADLST